MIKQSKHSSSMPVQALTKRAETDEHRFNQRSALRFQSYCALVRYVCSLSLSLSLFVSLSLQLVFHPWSTVLSWRRS